MTQTTLSDELPAKNNHVIISIMVVLVICVALYLLDLCIVNKIANETVKENGVETNWIRQLTIFRSVVENLIAGAIGALLLALTFRFIVTLIDPRDRVIEVAAGSITARLRKNAQKTKRYIFIGNTASFVTATILPILVDAASESKHPRIVDLYLVDPIDLPAVTSYSNFKCQVANARSKVADKTIARWVAPMVSSNGESPDEVVAKLLSSIYLAAYSSIQSSVNVTIYLRRSFTPFRADMTDSEIVLTQESQSEAAVAFSATGEFYGWYHKEADAQQGQSERIDLTGNRNVLLQMALAHPRDPLAEIESSILKVVSHFPHLNSLIAQKAIIKLAAVRVARPSHPY